MSIDQLFIIGLFSFAIIAPIAIIVTIIVIEHMQYKNSSYYQITKLPYRAIKYDKGRFGEYFIYKQLQGFELSGTKFLFNLYIPKLNGETTEIDIVMINSKGVFVIESKNYGGWIFGSEHQKYWYQTLPQSQSECHKERFYNPIMQNRGHLNHLKTLIGDTFKFHSIIAFSGRSVFKNVDIKSTDIGIVNGYNVFHYVSYIINTHSDSLTQNDIDAVYNILFPYTQVDTSLKNQHISNIQNYTSTVQVNPYSSNILKNNIVTTTNVDCHAPSGKQIEEKASSQTNRCPICNGELVVKTAIKGVYKGSKFYGCANYPKCHYIQNK